MELKRVGIVLFDDVLDFCEPLEVFSAVRVEEAHRVSLLGSNARQVHV